MPFAPLLVSLPTADRVRAHGFYRDALGLEAIGEPAEDGVPEPLQLIVNEATRLMLVPTGGFGWGVGDHDVASPGTSECVLGLSVADDDAVDVLVAQVGAAGARIVAEPASQPWGYTATFADPDGHLWGVTAASSHG